MGMCNGYLDHGTNCLEKIIQIQEKKNSTRAAKDASIFYEEIWVTNINLLFYQMVNGNAILFTQTELNTIPKGGDIIFQKLPYAVKYSNGLLTGTENEVQLQCTITTIPMAQRERELLSLECQKSTSSVNNKQRDFFTA